MRNSKSSSTNKQQVSLALPQDSIKGNPRPSKIRQVRTECIRLRLATEEQPRKSLLKRLIRVTSEKLKVKLNQQVTTNNQQVSLALTPRFNQRQPRTKQKKTSQNQVHQTPPCDGGAAPKIIAQMLNQSHQ